MAVVGAPCYLTGNLFATWSLCQSEGPGAAYVFVQSGSTWSQQAELTASDGKPSDEASVCRHAYPESERRHLVRACAQERQSRP